MNIDDLTIREAKKLATMFGGEKSESATLETWPIYAIVVLDRGFVYVGLALRDGDFLRIDGAMNIRRWGTTRGLAELVTKGPTKSTEMDAAHDLIAPMRAVISIHPTKKELWK